MTYARYWAMTLATAVCGGAIAVERFAFNPEAARWIAFGVAICATVFSIGAFGAALLRQNHAFSGLAGISGMLAGWMVIALLVLNRPTALWIAFAGGVAVMLVSIRGLAVHETTVERVLYALERRTPQAAAGEPDAAPAASVPAAGRPGAQLSVSKPMRSWMYWLAHTGLEMAGAFIVLLSFALTAPGTTHPSPRWIAFGIGIGAACVALVPTIDRMLALTGPRWRRDSVTGARFGAALSAISFLVAIGLVVTMPIFTGSDARWLAFALGCGMVGVSLLAHAVHEFTSERVRHVLEVAEPDAARELGATITGLAV